MSVVSECREQGAVNFSSSPVVVFFYFLGIFLSLFLFAALFICLNFLNYCDLILCLRASAMFSGTCTSSDLFYSSVVLENI